MDTLTDRLPPHLEPFFQPTPSGVAKLLAVWDGLQVETQIEILTRLDRFPATEFPSYLRDKVARRAFESGTAYIRYLAVRYRWLGYGLDGEWKARIDADPDPLVRYAPTDYCLDDHDKFWALPHEARLRQVRYLGGYRYGQRMATAVLHAMENHLKDGRVSETELYEVLADYLLKPGIAEDIGRAAGSWDGGVAVGAMRDFESLWGLVLAVPPMIAELLVKALPAEADVYTDIPENAVAGLNDKQLATLLYRQDVALPDIRKDLFKTADRSRGLVRSAAVSSHFCLDNTEFTQLLALPDDDKFVALSDLATDTGTLMLCHYEAIGDLLSEVRPREAQIAKSKCEWRLEHLADWPDWFQEKNLLELRLYLLAYQVADAGQRLSAPNAPRISGFPDAERECLAQLVVPGDIWSTFLAFENAWNSSYIWKDMEKLLPRLSIDNTGISVVEQKLDEVLKALRERPGELDAEAAASESPSQSIGVVEQKLDDILEALRDRAGDIQCNKVAADALLSVTAAITTLRENLEEDAKMVTARGAALEKSNSKLRGLLWAVIILTGIILLRTF